MFDSNTYEFMEVKVVACPCFELLNTSAFTYQPTVKTNFLFSFCAIYVVFTFTNIKCTFANEIGCSKESHSKMYTLFT